MRPDMSRVTHVIVGFSAAFLPAIDRMFDRGQVLFLEEEAVVRMRDAAAACVDHPAVAGILEVPCQDEERAGKLCGMLSRPPRLMAVLPGVEYAAVAAAELADSWRVPGAGIGAARTLRDKARLRHAASIAGIPQPAWAIVDTPDALAEFSARHEGKCVVKPVDRQGSLGVIRLSHSDSPHAAWEETLAVREHGGLRAREQDSTSRYLAEELMTGAELSVQALVVEGDIIFANVTSKDVLSGRYPVELAHTVPAATKDALAPEVIASTQHLVSAIDFQRGIVHSEWIVDNSGTRLVECAGRVPGDKITTLIELAYGTRFIEVMIQVMEGGTAPDLGAPRLGASIRYLTATPGVVTHVSGVDQAYEMDDVVDVSVTVTKGSVVRPLRSSMDRVGSVIAVSQTAREARDAALAAAATIDVATRGG
jgi:biotin carboxylase